MTAPSTPEGENPTDIRNAVDWAERVANMWRQSQPTAKEQINGTGQVALTWALDRLTECMSEIPEDVVRAVIDGPPIPPRKGV